MTPTPEETAEKIVWDLTKDTIVTAGWKLLAVVRIASAIREAIEAEREACAKVADEYERTVGGTRTEQDCKGAAAIEIAAAIRARSAPDTGEVK